VVVAAVEEIGEGEEEDDDVVDDHHHVQSRVEEEL
jgi:hypothetical protein